MKQWAEMLVDEYEAVYESVKKYDGFYIGRYELTGTTTSPTVHRNKAVLTADSSQAGNWYALKKACNEIVSTNEVQSIMIYGNMWDETMQWLIDTGAKTEEEVKRAIRSEADYILLDQGAGGTGETFDWSLVPSIKRPWFLAGGLGCENLESAIHLLHPWAVGLSSSVETDGHKDPDKIVKEVQTVRNIKEDF